MCVCVLFSPFVELMHVAPKDLWPNAEIFLKQLHAANAKKRNKQQHHHHSKHSNGRPKSRAESTLSAESGGTGTGSASCENDDSIIASPVQVPEFSLIELNDTYLSARSRSIAADGGGSNIMMPVAIAAATATARSGNDSASVDTLDDDRTIASSAANGAGEAATTTADDDEQQDDDDNDSGFNVNNFKRGISKRMKF